MDAEIKQIAVLVGIHIPLATAAGSTHRRDTRAGKAPHARCTAELECQRWGTRGAVPMAQKCTSLVSAVLTIDLHLERVGQDCSAVYCTQTWRRIARRFCHQPRQPRHVDIRSGRAMARTFAIVHLVSSV